MTTHLRILGLAICLLLASATDGLAAGKRRSGRRGKARAPLREVPAKTVPNGSSETAGAKPRPSPADVRGSEARAPVREAARQESRIEFDERMLRGQSAAGVIYLFQRTPSEWKSIVEVPDSFRDRTVKVLSPTEEKQ
jgi:hypothetical protein